MSFNQPICTVLSIILESITSIACMCRSLTDLPMAPTTLRVDGITRDSVTLRWDAPRDTGGVPLSGYIVEQQDGGKTAPGSAARWKVAAYVDAARTWWTVTGLIQGYEYWFRVRAENPDGAGSACALSSAVVPKPVVCKLAISSHCSEST